MELAQVEAVTRKNLPWGEGVPIIPIGDVQLQSNEDLCDLKRLERVIKWGVEHGAYFIGMGDYCDEESPSNRVKLETAGFYDSLIDAIDLVAEQRLERLMNIFEPTVGRWLGLLEGHHYHVFQDGTTTDMRLANFLKAPYLGTCAMIRVAFKTETKHAPAGVTFWAHHGRGNGSLSSAPLNKLEHIVKGFDADVYLMGHTHKAGASRLSRIYPRFGSKVSWLEHRDMFLVSTGSFLKGYLQGHKRGGRPTGTYVEAGMMNPVSLGAAIVFLTPHNDSGRTSVEVNVTV